MKLQKQQVSHFLRRHWMWWLGLAAVGVVLLLPNSAITWIITLPTGHPTTATAPMMDDAAAKAEMAKFQAWLPTCHTWACDDYRETQFLGQALADGKISRAAYTGAVFTNALWSPLGALLLVAVIIAAGVGWYGHHRKRRPKRPNPASEPLLLSTPYGVIEILENRTGSMAPVIDADEDPPCTQAD